MGWNTASVFVLEAGEVGYFGTLPLPNSRRTAEVLSQLGLRRQRTRLSTLDEGLNPPQGWCCVSAYEKGAIVCGVDELYGFVEKPNPALVSRLEAVFPKSTLLFWELGSATNYFAYAFYEKGQRQRAVAGSADRSIIVNEGAMLPEEESHLRTPLVAGGRLSIESVADDGTSAASGEALCFALTARFLGQPFDHFPSEKLTVELVKKASSNPLARFFGR